MIEITNLKNKRIEKGLLQREIADKAGISRSFYSLIETGSRVPSMRIGSKIALILNLTLDEFYKMIKKN